ncbi:MAG: class I SAM-dependent methyltransferase [Nisaea sp.]|uniref:class I SAM-dependent methyltransferase n=1 Tax=Nisaea sp. TaxID=2024842 RepID=UPI001B1605B0|nr:class I SAM-dependent methyltransferase [Nisaea sp.]MBO6560153.1 class I SAM-dependent methyltransferase [Nisaea sp.]
MTSAPSKNSEFVFKDNPDGSIDFVGDFEGLYKAIDDPWSQQFPDERMRSYYAVSRDRLIESLSREAPVSSLVEVGCGLGQVCSLISNNVSVDRVIGLDISDTAVIRARASFPKIEFHVTDIRSDWPEEAGTGHDVIILNQILWYILPELPDVIRRLASKLKAGGCLYIQQAFLRDEQKFGREFVDGFGGLVSLCRNGSFAALELEYAVLNCDRKMAHDDGLLILRR